MNPFVILALPIASAILIHFVLSKKANIAAIVGTVATAVSLVVAILLVGKTNSDYASALSVSWISIPGVFEANIGITLDKLSTNMMLIVTGIGTLVHVFSLAYMKADAAKTRYFGNLSLFMFSMTGVVLADNFVMTFIFWELVGLSSYLLIGHWYEKHSAGNAAKKAFLVNRIGDFGFMIGILMLWAISKTVVFSEMSVGAPAYLITAATPWVLGLMVFFIFMGAMGKSAQAPLHVWLPDAMEGPTPVSALIHAATMVAAGVYMMARLFTSLPLDLEFLSHLWSMDVIAWIGGITALLAALMATQQDDIKKILAYSTLSQLGYMVMAVGLANPDAGMFHLYTHAWFKALLFLGSGALIYACHHDQNIWNMGGLLKKMPITAWTFIIGTAALIAVPGTSGFFSKEGILQAALDTESYGLFAIAAGVAALTTFYMLRLIFVAILGKPKHKHSEDAKEVSPLMFVPLLLLTVLAIIAGYNPIAEQIAPLSKFEPFHFHFGAAFFASIGALLVGGGAAFVLYFNKSTDPLANIGIMKVFRNKFYIDEFYGQVVRWGQDVLAAIVHFIDEFFINGLFIGGLSRSAEGIGAIFRNRLQNGNLQTYSLVFGVGIAVTIYITVFA